MIEPKIKTTQDGKLIDILLTVVSFEKRPFDPGLNSAERTALEDSRALSTVFVKNRLI